MEKYGCTFLECEKCSTLYMSPRPTPAIMEEYYGSSENYFIWNKFIFPKTEGSRRENICRPNLTRLIEECTCLGISSPTLLEIGPGFGTFGELAKDSGFFQSVTVVERTPTMADACRKKGLCVIESTLEDVPDEFVGLADVAVCFEVIEHVFDPLLFLESICRMLRPGGMLMFTCPNGRGFDTEMLGKESPSVDTEHVNLFNPDSIQVLLRRSGFEVVHVETPGRLDVEIVRRAAIAEEIDLLRDPFWKRILFLEFESLGPEFQDFLIKNRLSGNLRVMARKS